MTALAVLAVPAASAHHEVVAKCSDPLPILEFDAAGCAGAAYHGPYVAEVTCPYERILYDDVLGGPFTSVKCVKDIFYW